MTDDSANEFWLAETGLRHPPGGGDWSLPPSLDQRLPSDQVQAAQLAAPRGGLVTYHPDWPS